jgi:hypothetical protein
MSAFHPLRPCVLVRQTAFMGKRSGIPHTDGELTKLTRAEIGAELERARVGLPFAGSARMAKQWHKRIHWLENALAQRDGA